MSRAERVHLVAAVVLVLTAGCAAAVWVLTLLAGPAVFARFPLRALPRVFLGLTVQWWFVGLLAAVAAYGLAHWLTRGLPENVRASRREEAHAGMAALAGAHFLGGLLVLILDGLFLLEGLPHWTATVGLLSCVGAALKFRVGGGGLAVAPVLAVVLTVVGWLLLPAELASQVDSLTR